MIGRPICIGSPLSALGGVSCCRLLRQYRINPSTSIARPTRPPTTPPITAALLLGLYSVSSLFVKYLKGVETTFFSQWRHNTHVSL